MPYFYDLRQVSTGSTASLTESTTFLYAKAGPSCETVSIIGMFAAGLLGTAGGGSFRLKDNTSSTGGVVTLGGSVTPIAKNRRGTVAAGSTWAGNSTTTITPGAILNNRLAVGFAQTGGMGGYVPIVPQSAVQMPPNSTVGFLPTDLEWTCITFSTSLTFDWTVEFGEGI